MPRFLCLLSVVLLTCLLGTTSLHAGDGYIRIEPTPKLNVFRSKHYRIYTTLSRTETVPYGRHMDALHEQYESRFRGLGERQIEPMPLYLFETEQQYSRFLQEHDIDATHSGGMFFVTHQLEGLATWVDGRSRRATEQVMQHEGFHQFAWHAFGPRLPVWLNEGLAQYFENAVLSNGRMMLGLSNSARVQKVRQAVRDRRVLPMTRLTSLSGDDWGRALRKDPTHSSLLYAQAWSITYFLVHGDDGVHKPKLMAYLKRLARGEQAVDAELMTFGQGGFKALEARWRSFASTHKPDEVTQATERMTFLGTGLRVLANQNQAMPEDLNALRDALQRFGFRLRRSELGVTREYTADRDELYRYHRSDRGDRAFVLRRPDQPGLPPRISAPGLDPEPMLVWSRDSDGQLIHDITYK